MIKMEQETGVIYSVICKTTQKIYIGQARDFKYKDGKRYNYGMLGRWSDHKSDAKTQKDNTPFHLAINKYGHEDFILQEHIRRNISELDGLEASFISENNTLVPNGYNVARHSRVKNRESSNVAEFYVNDAISLEVKPIKNDGFQRLVYVYLERRDGEKVRFVFGQNSKSTFDEAYREALDFVIPFQQRNIPVEILDIDDPFASRKDYEYLKTSDISKIGITTNKNGNNTLVVVYCYFTDGTDKHKSCFGGKKIETIDAYHTALKFIERIRKKDTIIEETKILKEFLKSATGSCK